MKINELTVKQHKDLRQLWMIYGNNGPKHSNGNHKFIQHILEHTNYEIEPWSSMITSKLTTECIEAVNKVLDIEYFKINYESI